MQHIQSLEPCFKPHQSIAPFQVATVRPTLWRRIETKVERVLTEEKTAELIFGFATVLLTVGIFVSLAHAVTHYQIVPWP